MEYKYSAILTKALILLGLVNCDHSTAADLPHAQDRSGAPCVRCSIAPAPCPKKKDYSRTSRVGCHTVKSPCCDGTVNDYFQIDQFENLFSNRDSLEAHAKGFWDYHSFITASTHYHPYGFGNTYMNSTFFGTKEVAAFLAHVGTRTSCEYLTVSVMRNFNLGFGLVGFVECVRVWERENKDFFLVWFWFHMLGFKFCRVLIIILCLKFEDLFHFRPMDLYKVFDYLKIEIMSIWYLKNNHFVSEISKPSKF